MRLIGLIALLILAWWIGASGVVSMDDVGTWIETTITERSNA